MKLYSMHLSGNAYKARLGLALMGLEYDLVEVDWREGETRTEEFLRLNPRGQVPVLEDNDTVIWDSQAILVYLARLYAPKWFPLHPIQLAQVMQWLAVSENEIIYGLSYPRAAKLYGFEFDHMDLVMELSLSALRILEQRLGDEEWLAASQPTVADIACFPYVALSYQGGFDLHEYPAITRWIDRVKSLEGFVGMEGVSPLS